MIDRLRKFAVLLLIFLMLLFIAADLEMDHDLSAFVHEHMTSLLVLVLILLSPLVHSWLVFAGSSIRDLVVHKVKIREFEMRLQKLSAMEKYVLSRFVSEQKMEQPLDPDEGSVAWLASIKAISSAGLCADGKRRKYRISPFAMKVLTENPNWLH